MISGTPILFMQINEQALAKYAIKDGGLCSHYNNEMILTQAFRGAVFNLSLRKELAERARKIAIQRRCKSNQGKLPKKIIIELNLN